MSDSQVTTLGRIVLARLLVAGDRRVTAKQIQSALEPLLPLADLGQALDPLERAGWVERTRKGKTESAALTDAGRSRALDELGLDRLPPKTTWDKLKKTYLAALALGLPAPRDADARSFGGENGFKAALLRSSFDLPLRDYPTLDQAIVALSWKLLGLPPAKTFDAKTVQAALIRRALGDDVAPRDGKPDPKKEATRLLSRQVGVPGVGKDNLRLAALRRWVGGAPREPLDLDAFARRVAETARACPTGRFGENKVFIHHVWRSLEHDPAFAGMGYDVFKRRLGEANNARQLDLGRADLVEAMDPEDVRLSEVRYLGATFHFIRI